MRRWVWRALLLAAVLAALTGTALADEVRYPASGANSIRYDLTNGVGTVLGPVNKNTITHAKIPSAVNGVDITKIAANAFEGCTILDTVEIGKNVATIGKNAFINCTQFKHLYFPDHSALSAIEEYAFSGCSQLNNVILPPSQLTTIKAGTFSRCALLDTIYIPANVETIEATAFYMDAKLLILHYGNLAKEPTQGDAAKRTVHFALLSPAQEMEKATCTVDGKERVTVSCEECNKNIITEEHAIPATGHTPGADVAEVPATCVTTGREAGKYCTVCGQPAVGLGIIEIDRDKHINPDGTEALKISIPAVPATCTEKGSSGGMQCSLCGAVTTEPTEVNALNHDMQAVSDAEWDITKEATCTETGSKTRVTKKCSRCDKTETETEEIDPTGHTYALTEDSRVIKNDCLNGHITVKDWVCTVCGDTAEYWEYCPDAGTTHTENDTIDAAYLKHLEEKHGGNREKATGQHTPGKDVKYEDTTKATCTEDGERVYQEDYVCEVCGELITGAALTVTIPKQGHNYQLADENYEDPRDKDATCEEGGVKVTGLKICSRCGDVDRSEEELETTGALGHKWGSFVPTDGSEERSFPCKEGTATGTATCEVCGKTASNLTITLEPTEPHKWSAWTLSKDGKNEVRTCEVCGDTDSRAASNTPSDPGTSEPDDPDDPDDPSDPSKPSEPSTPDTTRYSVDLIQASNGSVSSSRNTAESGDRVTLTVWPNSGYELDMLRVTTSTSSVSTTSLGGGQYRFTMPAANVEVRVSFSRKSSGSSWTGSSNSSSSSQGTSTTQTVVQSVPRATASGRLFSDIPASHWAAGEINWANQMGYMNGSNGRFNPDGNITFQQMWMVLARITGSRPASMADARRWAVNGGFADGSSPTGAVSRHQLVTALYRCAHLMGTANRNTTTLASYPDSRTVPTVAREPFAWAVANGIISGNASGRLDPNGTLTRAQFAVILYRFSQRV